MKPFTHIIGQWMAKQLLLNTPCGVCRTATNSDDLCLQSVIVWYPSYVAHFPSCLPQLFLVGISFSFPLCPYCFSSGFEVFFKSIISFLFLVTFCSNYVHVMWNYCIWGIYGNLMWSDLKRKTWCRNYDHIEVLHSFRKTILELQMAGFRKQK